MAPELRLLEHRRTINNDFEPAAARRHQLNVSVLVRLTNRGRQTGGPGFVVSDNAEFDRNAHGRMKEAYSVNIGTGQRMAPAMRVS